MTTPPSTERELVDRLTRYRSRLVREGRSSSLVVLDRAIAEARAAADAADGRAPCRRLNDGPEAEDR